MPSTHCRALFLLSLCLLSGCGGTVTTASSPSTTSPAVTVPNPALYADNSGETGTYSTSGPVDASGVFFQAIGANQRTCATCHAASQSMSISAASSQALYASSAGLDALFAPIDGANCPTVTASNQTGHSLILNNGLIRVAKAFPAASQFSLAVEEDPYGCAQTTDAVTGSRAISVYRRPLPTTNVNFFSSVMWDTRETLEPLTTQALFTANLATDLGAQTTEATLTHFQATSAPGVEQVASMVSLMTSLFTAQATDNAAGSLTANGALGGPLNLASVTYYPGINDAFGQDPTGAKFDPHVFRLYDAWQNSTTAAQASIQRGEQIFNTAPLTITGVGGINDNPALGSPQALQGSCATCHDTPGVGSHSLPLVMDTGIAHVAAKETNQGILAGLGQLSVPLLPAYQITGCTNPGGQAVTFNTSDPGEAMVSGECADISRFKVPGLRGLAARAPYFHNGSATSLQQVVEFYNARFRMNLNAQQKADLVNFLAAL